MNEFVRNRSEKDGIGRYCRPCHNLMTKEGWRRRRRGVQLQMKLDGDADAKKCPRCGEVKPKRAFVRNRSTTDGVGAYCRPCHNLVIKAQVEKLHGSRKNFLLKLRYGIDEDEFQRLVTLQDGMCAICKIRPAEHVDHDHETGKVRQILCFYCNRGLGKFKDDPERMERAIEYLAKDRL